MSANYRAPKQWQLSRNETVNSFENWKSNLLYILSLDNNFSSFLAEDFVWERKTSANPNRGLTNDAGSVPVDQRRTAAQKNAQLEMMLGFIANYCIVISRNSIIKQSISLADIWQKIRQHFGFQNSGAHFLDLVNFKLEPDERPEDLYQRLVAFYEDNLLTVNGGIKHHGADVTADEDLSPTMENNIVLLWLQLVHPGLPQLVKQRYGAELRNQTLASLKPEISQALSPLLDELRFAEDTKAMRANTSFSRPYGRKPQSDRRASPSCILCKTAKRPGHNTHFLSTCKFLPEADRRYFARSRMVTEDDVGSHDINDKDMGLDSEDEDVPSALIDQPSVRRVDVVQSPYLNVFYGARKVSLTLDTGATTNMILASFAKSIGLPIKSASQKAYQADGTSHLQVVGEVHCTVQRDHHEFQLDGLVIKQLDVDVLAGNPFMVKNDVAVRPAKKQVVIGGNEIVYYGSKLNGRSTARRTQSYTLRAPAHQTVLLPGEFLQLDTPHALDPDSTFALEPRLDSPSNSGVDIHKAWPPVQEIESVGNKLRLKNTTAEPIVLKRHEHFCQVRAITTVDSMTPASELELKPSVTYHKGVTVPYSSEVKLDPDNCLTDDMKAKFVALHQQYDDVFNPAISKYSGDIEAVVNMGPTLPPQRKGRLPQYPRNTMVELQAKFDELEGQGVFAKPEQVNVSVEYLNLSFLVQKSSGGKRLVTAFGEVGKYSKPQPSLMPNVDSVLRDIGRWRYIIASDLLQSFYQLPLSHNSMKYCGIVTPFKGIRVYTRCAMGMPGSETCLEEVMSRVLGDLIQEGCVAKIADDLYIGGDTMEELLHNWSRVLQALQAKNLRLAARKTIVCPRSTNILGWVWSSGSLQASSHKVSALSSVSPPNTVQGLRSFVGAYKILGRVIPSSAILLDPLEQTTAGKASKDKIIWSEDLLAKFKKAQLHLTNCKSIALPQPSDQLWIITDASVKVGGLGATLYCVRNDKLVLSGFYSAKLKKHQVSWLPCELEALCIGAAVKHFSPYIIQSHHKTHVLTDSRPCVQSYDKLCRGEFSSSSRVTTFLSIISRYQVVVSHIAGAANLPSDFASRHPIQCSDQSCQVCKFVEELTESVVRGITVQDVTSGCAKMPFTNRSAWLTTQLECPDLRRTHSHLSQGTRPGKKDTNIPDVKRYLKTVSIGRDGLLAVKDHPPFQPSRERIVVPRVVLHGLLTAMHIRFTHPSKHQTKQLFNRYFFALDLDNALSQVDSACHQCNSLRYVPPHLNIESTSPPASCIGTQFSADVMRRYKQCILVLRETVSSFTFTSLIPSEKHDDLRDAIIRLCAEMCPMGDHSIVIRVDAAPGFSALCADALLKQRGISIQIGHSKNVNKNPIAERCIEELGLEYLKLSPDGGPLTSIQLAIATANLNARIRNNGLSAREIWTQRDQVTGEQLPLNDHQIILTQHWSRIRNHPYSANGSKDNSMHKCALQTGDLVYLKQERDKTCARDKYLVVEIEDDLYCRVRKFTANQFRTKSYKVRIADCYPVQTNLSNSTTHMHIRGLDEFTDTDNDISLPPKGVTPPVQLTAPPGGMMHASHDDPVDLESSVVQTVPESLSRDGVSDHQSNMDCSISMNPLEVNNDEGEHLGSNVSDIETNMGRRRSERSRKPPAWQVSGDYIL